MSNSIASRLILKNPCISLLESCKTMAEFNQIHAQIYRTGLSQENVASTKVFEIFCSSVYTDTTPNLEYARKLFDQIPIPNTFTWNTIIRVLSKARNPTLSTGLLYKEMLQRGTKPNGVTFSFVSKGCSSDRVFLGLIHAHILEFGFCCDVYVLNSLTYGYSVSGSIDSARKIFDQMWCRDLVSWTVMINGYVRRNRAKEAVDLFFMMRDEQVAIDEVIVVVIFTACAQLGDLNLARRLESFVRESGVGFNSYMMNALIDMYSKCGCITDARKRFDEMIDKNLVSWNSMVSGYGRSGDMNTAKKLVEQMPEKNEISWSALLNGYLQDGNFKESLMVFNEMRAKGVVPNDASIVGAIAACAHLGALEVGQEIHLSINEQKVRSDVVLGTALVDMYVKCGCLEISRKVFDGIFHKNVISYNVMMLGLAVHGRASECFEIFAKMLGARVKPDGVTFVGILTACAHAGWLEEGKEYFNQMTTVYGISPQIEHISCMVHLMGRNGSLVEAYEFIKASPLKPDVIVWGALLGACKVHGNVELGESIAKQILDLDPYHGGAYVLLSSLNASAKRWDEVSKIRKRMKEMVVESRPGCSWIELNGNVHEFRIGDSFHPKIKEILWMLGLMEFRVNWS